MAPIWLILPLMFFVVPMLLGRAFFPEWQARRAYRYQMRQMRWAGRHPFGGMGYGWRRPGLCFGWIWWLVPLFLFVPAFRYWVRDIFRAIFYGY